MSVDKLVDSAQLDSDLTSVANAIRAKSGGSGQLAFPAGFVSAVQSIPTGGTTPTGTKQISITANGTTTEDVTNYASAEITVNVQGGGGNVILSANDVRTIRFYKKSESEISVDYTQFPNTDYYQAFMGSNTEVNWSKITITPLTVARDARGMFYCNTAVGDTALKEIVIIGTLKPSITSANSFLGGRKGLKTITGLLSLNNVTSANCYNATNPNNMFYNCTALQDVSFVAGSMPSTSTNWVLSWCQKLSDASLVSIANALKDTYSGTITFHATPKARLASIMGAVTSDGTLSTFEIDEDGTVSLEDFLTMTKGASIA